jgi:hypothetical protein
MIQCIKSIHNLLATILAIVALAFTVMFVNETRDLDLTSSPKALVNLHEIYLPPLVGLQVFIFMFDLTVCLYYMYHWPLWNGFKHRFVYYQYESQPVDKQGCS